MDDHLRLLSSQFLARSLNPNHVSYPYTSLDQGPRKLRHTLRSKVIGDVEPYLEDDGTISGSNFHKVKDNLHTDIVRKAISRSSVNRVIGRKPPPININENHLPRASRVALSQLRSGHCARLRDYQLKYLKKVADDLCPNCQLDSQSVSHLFDCPAKPTTLTSEDLWNNPWGVADFLRSLPEFSDLPPPDPPPPRRRPPPRPPPAPPDPPPASPVPRVVPVPVPPGSPIFTPLSPPPSPFRFSPPDSPQIPGLLSLHFTPPTSPSQD